jgi:hypothetical protein
LRYVCGSLNQNDFLDAKVERKGERSHGGKGESKTSADSQAKPFRKRVAAR